MPIRKRPEERHAINKNKKPFDDIIEFNHNEHPNPRAFAEHFITSPLDLRDPTLMRKAGIACLIFLNMQNYEKAWKAFEDIETIERIRGGSNKRHERLAPGIGELFGAIAAYKIGKMEEFERLMQIVIEFLPADKDRRNEIIEFLKLHKMEDVFRAKLASFKSDKMRK